MAGLAVAGHLSAAELGRRYRAARDRVERGHLQVVWLLVQGRSRSEVARVMGLSGLWVAEVVRRYNAVYGRSPLCKGFLGEAWHARCELLTCIRPSVGRTAAGLDG